MLNDMFRLAFLHAAQRPRDARRRLYLRRLHQGGLALAGDLGHRHDHRLAAALPVLNVFTYALSIQLCYFQKSPLAMSESFFANHPKIDLFL